MANGADGSIIIDTGLDTTGFSRGSDKFKSAVNGLIGTVNNLGKQTNSAFQGLSPSIRNVETVASHIEEAMSANVFSQYLGQAKSQITSLVEQMTKLGVAADSGFSNDKQLASYQQKLEETKAKIDQIKERMDALANQPVNSAVYDAAMQNAEAAEYRLSQLEKRQQTMRDSGVKTNSASWRRLDAQIQAARATLDGYLSQIDRMESAGAQTGVGRDSNEYKELAAALGIAEQAYSQYAAAAQRVADQQRSAQQEAAEEVRRQEEAAEAARIAAERHDAFRSRLQAVVGVVMRANGAILTLGKNLAIRGFTALSAGIKNLVGNLRLFNRQGKNASITSKGLIKSLVSLKTMLISRIKGTFISSIFKDVGTAIQSLAKHSSAFNAAMSSMQNASKSLSGNIAVSFGNLVNAVAPAITTIINLISQAITYLNAFFALLSGRSTMTVAKKSTDDYASSLKKAGGAAKDLKNQVYGFDELNKEQDKSGGGSGAGAVEFEDVAINSVLPQELMDYFQSIKDAIAAQDWEGVGGLIATGLNSVVTALDNQILAIHDRATQIVEAVARVGNGLVYGFDWSNAGKTLADGIMLVLDMMKTALETFDFKALGAGIAQGINGLFANINWQRAGATFALKWNSLIHTIQGFVYNVDWVSIGSGIANAIIGWFETIDWIGIADTLAVAINGLASGLETSIETIPWLDIGKVIGDSVMLWAESIDWKGLGTLISDAITGLFETVNSFASAIDWKSIGAYVGAIIDGFDIVTWGAQAGQLLNNFYESVYNTIAGLFEGIDWVTLGTNLWDSLIAFVSGIDYAGVVSMAFEMLGAAFGAATGLVAGLGASIGESLKQAFEACKTYFSEYINAYGGDIVAGLLAGIVNAIKAIGTWIYENIFTPFIEGFKSAFGINSPSTVMQEMGGYLVEGLLNGIKAVWNTLTSWFGTALESLKTTIQTAWTNITKSASTAWTSIKTTVSAQFTNLKTSLSSLADGIKTNLSNAWNSAKSTASNVWTSIKTTVTTQFTNLKTSLTSLSDGIKKNLSNAWNSMKTTASSVWTSIKTTVTTQFTNLKTSVTNAASSLQTGLSNTWNSVKSTATTAWTNLKTTVSEKFNSLKTSLLSVDFTSIGSNLVAGIKSGINGAWTSFKSWVNGLCGGLIKSVKKMFGINSPSKVFAEIGEYLMDGLGVGVNTGEKSAIKQVEKTADNLINSMDGIDPIQLAIDGAVSGFDGVVTKLSETAKIFSAIADALTSMGSLQIPSIAEGSFIPYKTRISDTPSEISTLQSELKAAADDQQETMEDMRDLIREIRNIVERLHLVVDANSLAKAISGLQRAEIRSYGGV